MPLSLPDKLERDEEKRSLIRRAEGTTLSILINKAVNLDEDDFFEKALDFLAGPLKETALPENDGVMDLEGYFYCLYLFAVFQMPCDFGPDINDSSYPQTTLAEMLLKQEPEIFRNDQIQFIKAAIGQPLRALLIEDLLANSYLKISDLVSGEQFTVLDRGLSEAGSKGIIMLGAVFKMWGDYYLLGTHPRCLPAKLAGELLRRKKLAQKTILGEISQEMPEYNLKIAEGMILRAIFFELLAFADNHNSPHILNTDQDEIIELHIKYELQGDPFEASKLLLSKSKQFEDTGSKDPIVLVWYGLRPKKDPAGDPYLRGKLILKAGELSLYVNSKERAKKLCKQVEKVLRERIDYISEEIVEANSSVNDKTVEEDLEIPIDLARALQEKIQRTQSRWLEEPVPALGNLTPRQAAKDPEMRKALEALLLSFEEMASKSAKNVFTMDVKFLRAQLFGEGLN